MQLICEAYAILTDLLGHASRRACRRMFTEWNKGDLDSFLDRDHRRHPQPEGPDDRRQGRSSMSSSTPPGRRAPASGRSERRSTWAFPRRRSPRPCSPAASPRSRTSASAPARRSTAPSSKFTRRRQRRSIDAVRDALYCSKICSYAQGFDPWRAARRQENKLEAELRRDRADLARRLHHPRPLPAEDHRGLRRATRSLANLLLDPYFNKIGSRRRRRTGARSCRSPREDGVWRARVHVGPVLLRRLPRGPPAGEPAAGAARLLRGAHLRAHGSAARRRVWCSPRRPHLPVLSWTSRAPAAGTDARAFRSQTKPALQARLSPPHHRPPT